METNELLKKVRKIEIKTRGLSNQVFSGSYHSAFKGRGMSFSEVREYQYGDDVRSIDWNVTARFNQPFIKVFEEERELTLMLCVDVSESSFFGAFNQTKNDLMVEMAAVLAFSAMNNNDKVGVLFFTDKIEKFIPPKKGRSHVLRIIRELIEFHPESDGTDLSGALEYINNILKKRSILFVMSDFMDDGYKDALNIANRRHDVVGVHIHDQRERELPDIGLVRMVDAESREELWVDSSMADVRKAFSSYFIEHIARTKSYFQKTGTDFISVSTTDNYINKLMNLFSNRGARR